MPMDAYTDPTTTATDLEESLREYQRAHEHRMNLLEGGDLHAVADAARHERDAICRHAAAVRANAVRLAKAG
jgi:hypothetical protein